MLGFGLWVWGVWIPELRFSILNPTPCNADNPRSYTAGRAIMNAIDGDSNDQSN